MALESLFLDEGFSTLDAESQSRVADALQVLQSGKRLIGIITHVQALADQMPARIEIERTLSGSRVRRGSGIARNQNPAGVDGDTENLRVEIRIRLKDDPQAGLASLSFLRPLETFHHLRRHRMPILDLLENTLLILQVSIYFRRMFQNECDSPVNLSQRTDGWISFENGFRRPPAPEVARHNVKTNTRSGDVVAAVMDFDVFAGGNHDSRSISFYPRLQRAPPQP